MKLNNIGNVLLKIFACIFTLMSSYLLFINVTSNYGRLFPMNKFIVIIGAIIILAILLMLKFMFNKLSDKTLVKISAVFAMVLIILQVIFIIYCRVIPSWDFGVVFNDAYKIANSVFELPEYYYKFYPNNIGALLMYTALFKFISLFTVNKMIYLIVGSVFNIMMIDGALLITYILIKKVFNLKMAAIFSFLSIFIVPLFAYSPILYTDTTTMIFPMAIMLLLYNYNESKSNARAWYLIGIGMLGALGVILKTNIIIALVAVIIYIVCTNKIMKSLINNIIIILSFLVIFSFYKVIGEPSSKDGYKEADAYGKDNEIIKVVGGGNCQISTTIYNAALGVNGLEVTERHEHDMPVAYVEDGKDATVSYGSLDLKFKNNNDFDIKLTSETKDDKVTVKIFRIS